MNINEQPGINIDGIILAESFFKRLPNIINPLSIIFDIKISNNINKEKKQLVSEVRTTLNNENDQVYGYCIYVGIFSIKDNENMSLEQFAENNAAACIFPYIREEIQNRSIKAGLAPIIIQPINIVALNNK
ncbi:MAG: hypothetical protein GY754_27560 [bacterium]|nr:hypothetical protein [bacterium]